MVNLFSLRRLNETDRQLKPPSHLNFWLPDGGVLRRENERRAPIERGGLPPVLVGCVVHFLGDFFFGAPAPADTHEPRNAGNLFRFFLSSRAEHNQNPPADTANRHYALISTRRKIAVSPAPPPELRALAAGRSCTTPRARPES